MRDKNLTLLWMAQFISEMGNAVFVPCAAWLATEVSGRNFSVGLVVFVAAVPYLLFGPWAGALVDRHPRRTVMVVSDVARAALLLLLPAWVAWGGGLSLELLVAIVFAVGVFSVPFNPARDALIPVLARDERKTARWNAMVQTSAHLAMFVGLGVGGWMLAHASTNDRSNAAAWVIQLDGLTFVLSAALLLALRVPRDCDVVASRSSYLDDTREGFRLARRNKTVRALMILTALNNLFLMGPALVGPPLLIKHVYGLDVAHLAWFECAMAGGMLVGALWLTRRSSTLGPGTVLLVALVIDGLTYLPLVWIKSYPWALVAIALHGLFIPAIVVSRTTIAQRAVPSRQRGRVFALLTVTVQGMTALSALLVGVLAEWMPATALFGIAGVFATLTGIWGLVRVRTVLRVSEANSAL